MAEHKFYKFAKGEKYMSDGFKEHIRRILNNTLQKIEEKEDDTLEGLQNDTSNTSDPADRADKEIEFATSTNICARERLLKRKIMQALELLDQQEDSPYGWCEACDEEIGAKRLETRPTATLCVGCKEEAEKKEKQQGR